MWVFELKKFWRYLFISSLFSNFLGYISNHCSIIKTCDYQKGINLANTVGETKITDQSLQVFILQLFLYIVWHCHVENISGTVSCVFKKIIPALVYCRYSIGCITLWMQNNKLLYPFVHFCTIFGHFSCFSFQFFIINVKCFHWQIAFIDKSYFEKST